MSENSFDARADLEVGGRSYEIYRLDALQEKFDVARLPFSLKVLLENLLRNEDGVAVRKEDIEALASWDHNAEPSKEIAFTPGPRGDAGLHGRARDRRPRRDARRDVRPRRRSRRRSTRWCRPSWSSTTRSRSTPSARATRSASTPSASSSATRSATGSCAGARRRSRASSSSRPTSASSTRSTSSTSPAWCSRTTGALYPDTLVGTDSHTTMINGVGVLGWGVGGIEAEAAMLGQAMSMLIPRVVGFKLGGELPEGATATDLVLTVTQRLREHGVVGKFVEFYGPGVPNLPLADRATIGNMSPEFGSTCAIFPIDAGDAALPRVHGPLVRADRDRRGLRPRPGPVARRRHRGADVLARRWSSTSARSSRRWRAPSAPRTASR